MKKISFLFTVIIFILSGNRASAQTELQSATLQQGRSGCDQGNW